MAIKARSRPSIRSLPYFDVLAFLTISSSIYNQDCVLLTGSVKSKLSGSKYRCLKKIRDLKLEKILYPLDA